MNIFLIMSHHDWGGGRLRMLVDVIAFLSESTLSTLLLW